MLKLNYYPQPPLRRALLSAFNIDPNVRRTRTNCLIVKEVADSLFSRIRIDDWSKDHYDYLSDFSKGGNSSVAVHIIEHKPYGFRLLKCINQLLFFSSVNLKAKFLIVTVKLSPSDFETDIVNMMLHGTLIRARLYLLTLLLLVEIASAENDSTEIALNVFSDLAPYVLENKILLRKPCP